MFPAERRGAAIGTLEGFTGLAVVAGPLVGGLVASSRHGSGSSGRTVAVGVVLSAGDYSSIDAATSGVAVALGACGLLSVVGRFGAGALPRPGR